MDSVKILVELILSDKLKTLSKSKYAEMYVKLIEDIGKSEEKQWNLIVILDKIFSVKKPKVPAHPQLLGVLMGMVQDFEHRHSGDKQKVAKRVKNRIHRYIGMGEIRNSFA